MAYNNGDKGLQTKSIRGLVASGADLMKNMYDIKIYFPSDSGQPSEAAFDAYPVTVRAEGFKIPDVDVEMHEISYHGVTIKMPSTKINMDRTFDITFREDASFDLRKRFTSWHSAVVDPVNGGVANAAGFFGKVEVAAVSGAYWAPTMANDIMTPGSGIITNDVEYNKLAVWAFYNVWVSKVAGIDFNTGSAEPNTFGVTFQFMDYDAPQYAENALDLDLSNKWTAQ